MNQSKVRQFMPNIIKTNSPAVMGIINMSPDSFYTGSRCLSEDEFEVKFAKMLEDGASIIDIGACSTRPGSIPIAEEEEWELLKPALKKVLRVFPASVISIDTFRANIVERAFDFVGDLIINDISAGEDDSQMLQTAARLELPYIAMHKRGSPLNMQNMCDYKNVTLEVKEYLSNFVVRAQEAGIKEIVLDPGFGFAKNREQNYQLLDNLGVLKIKNNEGKPYPILVGLSRKSMIHKSLSITPEEALSATCALELVALLNGADILRAHDVKEAVQMVKLYELIVQNR